MKSYGRLRKVYKICNNSGIIRLNRYLRKLLVWNERNFDKSNEETKQKCTISCGIGNINVIYPYYRIKKGSDNKNNTYVLSFNLSLSDVLYNIKMRAKINDDLIASLTFYTLGSLSSKLMSIIGGKKLQKIVYNNGIAIVFNLNKYFGIDIKNVYDIQHLVSLYSTVDKQLSVDGYAQMVRSYFDEYRKAASDTETNFESKNDKDRLNNITDCEPESTTTNKTSDKKLRKNNTDTENKLTGNETISDTLDKHLYFNQKYIPNLFPLTTICKLRDYLYYKYNINNESYNLKMESIYNDIKIKPRIYKLVYKKQLDYGTLNPKLFEDKFINDAFDQYNEVNLIGEKEPFYGILLDRIESEQKVILNINSYYVDEIKKEVFPLYGIVDEDSFKYFSDKKIGDIAECEERDRESIKVQFKDGKPYIGIKRLYQESLIYSLRNRRYIPINEFIYKSEENK